jgi:hypothetical protein
MENDLGSLAANRGKKAAKMWQILSQAARFSTSVVQSPNTSRSETSKPSRP